MKRGELWWAGLGRPGVGLGIGLGAGQPLMIHRLGRGLREADDDRLRAEVTMVESSAYAIQQADAAEVRWPNGRVSRLPWLWLRDNCRCDECRVAQTSEKKVLISNFPAKIAPADMSLAGDELCVTWPDGHVSRYAGVDVRALGQDRSVAWSPWRAGFLPRRTDYRSFLASDREAASMIEDFLRNGVAVLEKAPTERGTLEELTPRLGPIREVLFDRIHDVEVDLDGYNVAHTTLALPPHNDFPSYSWPPSVQALHMLENETTGGNSFVVDGWTVLAGLREDCPEYFKRLCTTPVPFREFDENNETYAVSPIINCDVDGNIVAFRFSNQLMQSIDPNRPDAADFYRAYHELCARITAPAARVTFRLEGGQILLVAAHRVLHGREAFEPTGQRHLQDAYFELDNVRNHRVVLLRNQEAAS